MHSRKTEPTPRERESRRPAELVIETRWDRVRGRLRIYSYTRSQGGTATSGTHSRRNRARRRAVREARRRNRG